MACKSKIFIMIAHRYIDVYAPRDIFKKRPIEIEKVL